MFQTFINRFFFLFVFTGILAAQTVNITNPAANSTQAGTIRLAASLNTLPSAYTIEFDVGSDVACITQFPKTDSCDWNTYYWFGGPAYVTATVRDAAGSTLATSASVAFTVSNPNPSNNPNNTFSVTPSTAWTAPFWSGEVTFSLADGTNISGISMTVDGIDIIRTSNSAPQYRIDTSRFTDRKHKILFVFTATGTPTPDWNQVGQVEYDVTFNNSGAPMEARNNVHELPLCTTSQSNCPLSGSITQTITNTDLTATPSANLVAFSDNTAVLTVSGSGSAITANALGVGTAKVYLVNETETGTDLNWAYGNIVYSAHLSLHDEGNYIHINAGSSGGTTWIAGWYKLTTLQPFGTVIGAAISPTPCSPCTNGAGAGTFQAGPTAATIVQVNAANTIGTFGADGSAQSGWVPGTSILYSSWFVSGGALQDSRYPSQFSPETDYGAGGFNTVELGQFGNPAITPTTVESTWKSAQSSFVSGVQSLIANHYADGGTHVPFGWYLTSTSVTEDDNALYLWMNFPSIQAWSPPPTQYISSLWASKNVRGVGGGDEISAFLGATPTPGNITWGNGLSAAITASNGEVVLPWNNWSVRGNESSYFFSISNSGTALDYPAVSPCPAVFNTYNSAEVSNSQPGPFVITTGVNDTLSFTYNTVTYTTTLPAGTDSVSTVVSAINAAGGIHAVKLSNQYFYVSIPSIGASALTINAGNANATVGFTAGSYQSGDANKLVFYQPPPVPGSTSNNIAGAYNITTGTNDTVKVAMDGGATQTITLAAGTAVSASTIAAEIQAGLTGATVTAPSNYIEIQSNTAGTSSSIAIQTANANATLGFTVGTYSGIAGLANGMITSTSAPSLQVNLWAYGMHDAAGGAGPYTSTYDPGPCTTFNGYTTMSNYATQWNTPSGHSQLGWNTIAGTSGTSQAAWQGNPAMAGYVSFYEGGPDQLTQRYGRTRYLLTGLGPDFRYAFNYFGVNRAAPILGEGEGIALDWGFQGNPVAVSAATNGTINFGAPHGLKGINPMVTRMWITGSGTTAYNTNYFITGYNTANSASVAYATPTFASNLSGLTGVTATFSGGATASVTALVSSQGAGGNLSLAAYSSSVTTTASMCAHEGETFTLSTTGSSLGSFAGTTWYIPYTIQISCTNLYMLQVPAGISCASSCGTAYIVQDNDFHLGTSYIYRPAGMRYEFQSNFYQVLLGMDGVRGYTMDLDNTNNVLSASGKKSAYIFQDTTNTNQQAGAHPRYTIALANQIWHSSLIATKMLSRLGQYIFKPRLPCPDYGFSPAYGDIETSCRGDSTGGVQMIALLADGAQTIKTNFSQIAIAGQPTIRYCGGWGGSGITIVTIAPGTTSETLIMDPDGCQAVLYVASTNSAAIYSGGFLLSTRLPTGATDVVVQYSYDPLTFESSQVNTLTIPNAVDFGGASGMVPADPSIGCVYYRLIYLDSSRKVVGRGAVQGYAALGSTCPVGY